MHADGRHTEKSKGSAGEKEAIKRSINSKKPESSASVEEVHERIIPDFVVKGISGKRRER
jgi:hypothetical protein